MTTFDGWKIKHDHPNRKYNIADINYITLIC